jgi:DNA-binding protein
LGRLNLAKTKGFNFIRGDFMGRKTTVIPKAPVGRILLNAGAKRVSSDAMATFSDILLERTEKIAVQAAQIAKHAGRKTVNEGDVRLASKQN